MGQRHFPKTKEELNKLVEDLNINLGDIETCLITDMSGLFSGTERTDFSGIESWDTSNVTNMAGMFSRVEYFNENINSWNVSKVEGMFGMFKGANNFNQPLDKWDISSVKFMFEMFFCAKKFNQNLDSWNVDPIIYCNDNEVFLGSPLQNNPPKWYSD